MSFDVDIQKLDKDSIYAVQVDYHDTIVESIDIYDDLCSLKKSFDEVGIHNAIFMPTKLQNLSTHITELSVDELTNLRSMIDDMIKSKSN